MNIIISAVLAFIITMGGGSAMVFSNKHLATNECGLDIVSKQNTPNELHFSAYLDCSGKKISKYTITRHDDKLFVDLYARWTIRVPQSDGEFDYMLPDGINEIYLRVEKPEDMLLIWKRC